MAEAAKTNGGGVAATRSQKDRAAYVSPRVTSVKTDRSAKNNINGGLTEAQRAAVTAEETRVRKYKTEYAAVIDKDGKVTHRVNSGNAHHVSFEGIPHSDFKDAVIIHNHPGKGQREAFGNTLATRVGSPLSGQDLVFAAATDAAEIRATTYSGDGGGYTYSVRRPKGGWPSMTVRELKNLQARTRNKGQTIANNEFMRVTLNPSNNYTTDRQRRSRAELMAQWKSIQDMAKALGTTITRKRFNP